MRNLLKDIDKKFLISLMIIITALSTFMLYAYAQEVTDEMISEGEGMGNGVVGATSYMTVNDLRSRYPIFCCSKGTSLTGSAGATLVTELGNSDPEVTGKLLPGAEGMKLFETTLDGSNTETPFTEGTYTNKTYGKYVVSEVKVATPKEAYILAEMINNLSNNEDAGFKFIGEESGHKIEFTDTDLLSSATYIVVNEKTIYIIESGAGSESLVMQDTDGKYYFVEETSDEGLGVYSYVQRAWWNTEAGSHGNNVEPNGLSKEADLFEAYIKRIAKSMDTSEFVDHEFEINGIKGTVKAPELEYEPEWNVGTVTEGGATYDLDNPTVSWDSNKQEYKIGPFSINYVEEGAAVEGRNPVIFAGITNAELYTDASKEPLERNKDWFFEWQIGQRDETDTYEYPHENEIFYIRLKYIDGATKISNFKFDFKYMNAGGQYEKLDGTFYEVTWTAKEQANWCTAGSTCSHGYISSHDITNTEGEVTDTCDGGTACPHGKYVSHIKSTDYWVELESFSSPMTSQLLAGGLIGARWYEETKLEREIPVLYYKGNLKIEKIIVDESGNKLSDIDPNQYFTFTVKVGDHEPETLQVSGNSSVKSKIYTWELNETPPDYQITEIKVPGEYKLYEIQNGTGTLSTETETVNIVAKNSRVPNEGRIEVVKKVTDEHLNGRTFDINVKVTAPNADATFEYNGERYKEHIISGTVTAGGTWTSETIKWYGKDAPIYEVNEVPGEDYEIKDITPKTGSIIKTQPTKVTIINDSVMESGKIRIIKTLENAEYLTEEYINSLKFSFNIAVDGHEPYTKELECRKTETGYVWEHITDEFYWYKGENPSYTITEVNLPDKTEFVSATGTNTIQIPNGLKGTLTTDGTEGFIVENHFINKPTIPSEGRLELEKIIKNEELKNKEYRFTVKLISGSVEYKGVLYKDLSEEKPLYITNDSATDAPDSANAPYVRITVGESMVSNWVSDVFKWYGEDPTYTVEENMSGLSGIKATINPNTGPLQKDTQIKVTAENSDGSTTKTGGIYIFKTLENASKFTDEYIKSLVFSFNITVGGKDYGTVSLQGEKVDDTYVWEHRSEYTWDADTENPTYIIEEVDLPEGTELKDANSPNGDATITGTKIEGTLKPDSVDDFEIINNFTNKFIEIDPSGYLKIQKIVLDDSLVGKTFTFDIKVTGTFEYNGTEYTPNQPLILNDIPVVGGVLGDTANIWTSDKFTWKKNNKPEYEITEDSSEFAELVSVQNAAGKLEEGNQTEAQVAIFTNDTGGDPDPKYGYLQITKKLENGAISDELFYFEVSIEGYEPYTVGIKAGDTYRTQKYEWKATEEAPEYHVKEVDPMPEQSQFVSITNGETTSTDRSQGVSGKLKAEDIVNIVCTNKFPGEDPNVGKLKITKEVLLPDKVAVEDLDAQFTIQVKIEGTFEMNGESVVESERYITQTLGPGESFETPEIKWYGNENNAPTYEVIETSIPEGWELVNISTQKGKIIADQTVDVVVTNEFKDSIIEIELTMELAGRVWEDTRVENKELEDVATYGTQGIFDEDIEEGVDGVEVYIYKVLYQKGKEISRYLATAYEDGNNTKIEFPIYTQNGGLWSSPKVAVPALTEDEIAAGYTASYDIEFKYDGQTYEPTDFLVTSKGDANAYRKAQTAERDKWARDSMALDYDREEVNRRIAEVYGNTPIDGQGNTIGKVNSASGETKLINYKSTDYTEGLTSTRKISEIQTTDENGYIYDLFKATARTSQGGLTYPFDNRMHLESYDKYIDDFVLHERYKFSATYNYTLNINLGLLKREEADLGATKDLYSAKVIVNEKLLNYRFNSLADLTGSTISRQLKADDMNISYELGLYKTDYYYRAEIYQTDAKVYDAVNTFYKSIGKDLEDTELDVYLTYKINLYNESPNYVVSINSVDDYFDSSFGTPITDKETKYVQTVDGVSIESVTEVANKSYIETSRGDRYDVNWEVSETIIKGSDNTNYKKMTANFHKGKLRLASGEKAVITVTFKVQKDDIEGVQDAVITGQKTNVAEIANYSTYYEDGRIAGKIDKDSAPANVNIEQYNIKSWYEDDTDSAPILNLKLIEENRQIKGLAWEDKQDTEIINGYGQKVGNGAYDTGEAVIGGLTTQLVEKLTIKNPGSSTEYTEYDFLWPTSDPLDALGGKTLKSLTGFDSTIETARVPEAETDGLSTGEYRFEGVPVGNYVVRFLYGNDKTDLEDSLEITGDAKALKADGTSYSGNDNILTANYDNDLEGNTPAIYSGQDFKTTTYQSGISNTDSEGYLNNEWHDLNQDSSIRLSDARDNETRRLQTIAKSEIITNVNAEVLDTANDKRSNHTDLYEDYYMFADTAKINVSLENINVDQVIGTEALSNSNIPNGVQVKVVKGNVLKDGIAELNDVTYTIANIDVGLEERSENKIALDKQISSIKLITSDNNVIFNAIYDIKYEAISGVEYAAGSFTKIAEIDGKYIVAKVELNSASVGTEVLKAINKVEDKDAKTGIQNFRFIDVDETILQGATIEINYKFTALNIGETDRIDSKLQNIDQVALANNTSVAEEILKVAEEVEKQNAIKIKPAGSLQFNNTMKIGSYLGTTYYQGSNANGNDSIVTTTVRQLVDYVDNDTVFSQMHNTGVDHSWRNATVNEMFGNGYEAERLLDRDIVRENTIVDKNNISYITEQKNNVIVSIDNRANDETTTNKGFEIKLLPFSADETKYTSSMNLTVTRTVAAESDADHLVFDNIAEIVKYENTVGRRDIEAVPGNANPKKGEFLVSLEERDASATELITLSPPTGIETNIELTLQILSISLLALIIVAVGIVIIKKKVLNK